jgi:hypothetical protein
MAGATPNILWFSLRPRVRDWTQEEQQYRGNRGHHYRLKRITVQEEKVAQEWIGPAVALESSLEEAGISFRLDILRWESIVDFGMIYPAASSGVSNQRFSPIRRKRRGTNPEEIRHGTFFVIFKAG